MITMRWEGCGPGLGGLLICNDCENAAYCCPPWSQPEAIHDHKMRSHPDEVVGKAESLSC